jgi:hypothetical protein
VVEDAHHFFITICAAGVCGGMEIKMKKVYRYFFGFIDTQEKWLNKMAENGYRLVRISKVLYEFETCAKYEYEYCIEFVAEKSYKELNEYKRFLKEMGFRTFSKNLNLNYSFGKMKWRPWAKGMGQLASLPGSYNKELVILEKKREDKPFEIHTDLDDLIDYYRGVRNMYVTTSILLILLIIFGDAHSTMLEPFTICIKAIVAILCIFILYLAIRYTSQIHKYKENRKTNEQ